MTYRTPLGPVLVLALGSLLPWLASCSDPGRADAPETTWVPATRRDLASRVLATGIVRPRVGAEVRVGSRVSGIVRRLYVGVGDRVAEGDLLAELDPTGLEARMRQTRAVRRTARAELELARQDARRARELFAEEILAASELDRALASAEVAGAALEEAEANLAAARDELDASRLTAPIPGIVASVSTQEGETVAASFAAPTFVTIVDLDRLEVQAYVDETDIGRVEVGQQATFTVDTYPDTEFEGRVTAIQPAAEVRDSVVNYVARITIDDEQGRELRPEMTTTVEIRLASRQDVLVVPSEAVRRERGRRFVLVKGPGGDPVRRWVGTGWKDATHTQIMGGLEDDAEVLVGDVPVEESET